MVATLVDAEIDGLLGGAIPVRERFKKKNSKKKLTNVSFALHIHTPL